MDTDGKMHPALSKTQEHDDLLEEVYIDDPIEDDDHEATHYRKNPSLVMPRPLLDEWQRYARSEHTEVLQMLRRWMKAGHRFYVMKEIESDAEIVIRRPGKDDERLFL